MFLKNLRNIYHHPPQVRNHPMGWLWRKMPWYDWFFTAPLATNDLGFVSDQRVQVVLQMLICLYIFIAFFLQVIDVPIMILHAEDDLVVPFKLGKALYESALEGRASHWPKVHWREFSGQHGYAHKFICRAPELPDMIRYVLSDFKACDVQCENLMNFIREFERSCDESLELSASSRPGESGSNVEESDTYAGRKEVKAE